MGFNGIQSNYSLLKRAEYLVNDNRNVKTSQLISIFIILILTCSFLLIFEPFTIPHHVKEKSFDLSNDSYILQTEEGTFELYMNNERVAVIDNPDTDGMDELPIYEFEKEGKVIRE